MSYSRSDTYRKNSGEIKRGTNKRYLRPQNEERQDAQHRDQHEVGVPERILHAYPGD
jgi:hypothetical protein